jgi:hypothetical protein
MANKYYKKRGNLNWKERKLLGDIEEAIEKNPGIGNIEPATTFDELEKLHVRVASSDAVIDDSKPDTDTLPKDAGEKPPRSNPFIDPLNREEPNVRDYVLEDQFDPFADHVGTTKQSSTFVEPTDYDSAFGIPDEEQLRKDAKQPQQRPGQAQQRPQPQNNSQPSQDSGRDTRKSKRFAKTIVNTVCNLLEVGFVWYATKDISEQRLTEYEMSGEMDLSVLVELPDGTEATVKQFFLNQLGDIQAASKIEKEKRDMLVDSLTELFIEKNIQPSNSVNFAIDAVTVLAEQGMKIFMIVSQNNSILNQLRERNVMMKEQGMPTPPPPPPPPAPEPVREQPIPEPTQFVQTMPLTNEVMPIEFSDQALNDEMSMDLSLLDTIETSE